MLLAAALPSTTFAAVKPAGARKVISLDGLWEIAQGEDAEAPGAFGGTAPVPDQVVAVPDKSKK